MQPVTEMKIMIVMSISSLFCYECVYMCIYISRLKWFNFEMYMNAKLTRVGLLMGNFICQFDWATGYLDICSNIILGVSVRAFPDEMNSWRDRLSKADCPPLKKKKNLPAMQETQVQFLSRGDSLEQEMATHSSILAWRIPSTEEPGRLQAMGS